MDLIGVVFENVSRSDKVLVSFPDMYSFLAVSKKITEYYTTDVVWVLWTDAAVERINHLGAKFGFPKKNDVILIGTSQNCEFLTEIGRLRVSNDLPNDLSKFISDDDVIISMGFDFLEIYGYDLSHAVKTIVGQKKGITFNCITYVANKKNIIEKISMFHDVFIEVEEESEPAVTYHTYRINLRHSLRGGIAQFNETINLGVGELSSGYKHF